MKDDKKLLTLDGLFCLQLAHIVFTVIFTIAVAINWPETDKPPAGTIVYHKASGRKGVIGTDRWGTKVYFDKGHWTEYEEVVWTIAEVKS